MVNLNVKKKQLRGRREKGVNLFKTALPATATEPGGPFVVLQATAMTVEQNLCLPEEIHQEKNISSNYPPQSLSKSLEN